MLQSIPLKYLKKEIPTSCHLLFYFTSYVLNMFRTLIYPSSGACDCVVELPHRSSCSQFVVCWRFGWAHKKWNKIASDIKLVFHSSSITKMHDPINIRFTCFIRKRFFFRKLGSIVITFRRLLTALKNRQGQWSWQNITYLMNFKSVQHFNVQNVSSRLVTAGGTHYTYLFWESLVSQSIPAILSIITWQNQGWTWRDIL